MIHFEEYTNPEGLTFKPKNTFSTDDTLVFLFKYKGKDIIVQIIVSEDSLKRTVVAALISAGGYILSYHDIFIAKQTTEKVVKKVLAYTKSHYKFL